MPIHEDHGALAIDRSLGPATVPFTPGTAALLHSADGRVTVLVPPQAFAQALTLRHALTPLTDAIPPADARFTRGLGAFFLDATDDAGQAVHQFSQPVTLTVGYSPEQLQSRGIAEADLTLMWFNATTQTWQTIPTTIDPASQTATALVNHFTPFELGDGSSASDAFIPSVQGFQVSTFTGAASYSYPFDVPAGPAGIKPSLSLSYSSAATDGASGQRLKQQASWAGKGWSLDTGSVARNKLPNGDATYALSFNGQSYTLVRGTALPSSPYDTSHILGWDWTTTDDAFLRVRATSDDSWAVWTKDGTRFDFTTTALWGWSTSGRPTFESYKWLLTTITDTHGNTITYSYNRLQASGAYGPVDVDVWPNTISWAGGHYQVNFISSARTSDTQYEGADNQYVAAPHETRRLDALQVWSNPAGSWQLLRQYNLGHDYSLLSDALVGYGCPTGQAKCGDPNYPKLTLKSLQRIGNDGTSALPATTFAYGAFSYASANGRYWAGGAWNRLTSVNNGQGGLVTLAYANVGQVANSPLMENNRRITSRTLTDGHGNSYAWSYSYRTPNVNSLGTARGPQSPWTLYGNWGTQSYPNSAALYYNAFTDVLHDSQDWLAQKPMKEFRGHDWVLETDPNGAQIKHWFSQGEASDKCVPTVTGGGITADACFQRLRDGEFLKGKEYQTKVFAVGANVSTANPLQETDHAFVVVFFSYTNTPLTGLWRAFTAERQSDAKQFEGTTTPVVKTTKTFYNPTCATDTTATVGYGNVGCIQEYNGASLVRTTKRSYAANALDSWTWRDGSGNLLDPPPASVQYLVDRLWQDASYDGSGGLLSLTHQFYDALPNGTTTGPSVGTEGELRLVRKYYDVPLSCCTNITLHGTDTRTDYDSYGNPTVEMTYAAAGTYLNGVYSTPGAGSAARTTTATYDTTFHALPTQVTNPLNQIARADYDDRMGTLLRVTGPNTTTTPTDCSQTNYAVPSTNSYAIPASEQSSCAQYDVFGRMVALIKPGDSTSYPTLQASYKDTEQPFRYRLDRREVAGSATTRIEQQFYDGLGRKIQTKAESSLNAQNIVVDTRYDGLNQVSAQSQPHYLSENSATFYQYTVPGASLVTRRRRPTTRWAARSASGRRMGCGASTPTAWSAA